MKFVFVVYSKDWSENSIGEQSEGPWVRRKTCATREEAATVAQSLRQWAPTYGTWAKVEEEPQR